MVEQPGTGQAAEPNPITVALPTALLMLANDLQGLGDKTRKALTENTLDATTDVLRHWQETTQVMAHILVHIAGASNANNHKNTTQNAARPVRLTELVAKPAVTDNLPKVPSEPETDTCGQEPDNGGLSAAESAGEIAADLREVAALATRPNGDLNPSALAALLHNLAQDQTALAAHLAKGEEKDAGDEGSEASDAEPPGTVPPPEQAAPLTFEALNCAAQLLTRDVQTRLWPEQEAAELASLVTDAVATVRAATKAVADFFKELRAAADKAGALAVNSDGTPAAEPPGLQAVAAATDAAIGLVFAFQDAKRARVDLPLRRLLGALRDVQRGIKPELLTPVVPKQRTDASEGAHLKATAAAALHARLCAGVPPKAAEGEVVALLVGVRQTRSEHKDSKFGEVSVRTVRRWWRHALRGELTPVDAQARFDDLAELFGIVLGMRPNASPPPKQGESWGAVAAALDIGLRDILAGQPPGFTISGAALTKRQAERDMAAEDAAECGISAAKAHKRMG